jgi:hypothetical protein
LAQRTILRFRVSFNLILLNSLPFLLPSSLGAGLGKRTQKTLSAHQKGISIEMIENTAVAIYNQITFTVL